jgi:hypothetical protein
MSIAEFWSAGSCIFFRATTVNANRQVSLRQFRSLFGTTPTVCAIMWAMLRNRNRLPIRSKLVHLLCALLFLKVYDTEEVHAALTGFTEKTFRKWSWMFIELISELEDDVVSIVMLMFSIDKSSSQRLFLPYRFNSITDFI